MNACQLTALSSFIGIFGSLGGHSNPLRFDFNIVKTVAPFPDLCLLVSSRLVIKHGYQKNHGPELLRFVVSLFYGCYVN